MIQDPSLPIVSGSPIRAIDGDTLVASLDLPLGLTVQPARLRLAGIQAPEHGSPEKFAARASRDHLWSLCDGRQLLIQAVNIGPDRYGRPVCWIFARYPAAWLCLNAAMVEDQHAAAWWPRSTRYARDLPARWWATPQPQGPSSTAAPPMDPAGAPVDEPA